MEYTVECRKAANIIERSSAFKDHGVKMATELRDFGEKISKVDLSLQELDGKSSMVYESFDTGIEVMIQQLGSNGHHTRGTQLNKLMEKIISFEQFIKRVQLNILDTENIRHGTEGLIMDGLREAKGSTEANNEIVMVEDILNFLRRIASPLGKMMRHLELYESKVSDISMGVYRLSKAVQITEPDLTSLKFAVNNSKTHYHDSIKRV